MRKLKLNLTPSTFLHIVHALAPVAQLDRVSGYEPEGRRFESSRVRQLVLCIFSSRCKRIF